MLKLSALAGALAGIMMAACVQAAGTEAANTPAEVPAPVSEGVTNKEYKKGPVIKVASYNIAAARVSSLDSVTMAIKAIDADVIALNEVDNKTARAGGVDQAKYIAEKLGLQYAFGPAIDFEGGKYGIAVLSRYPISSYEVVNLPQGEPGVDEDRVVLAVEINHEKFDTPVVILNTHLDYKEDHVLQRKQIATINDIAVANVSLKQIRDVTTKVKILMGDFNDTGNSDNIAELSRYWDLVTLQDRYRMRTWPSANPMADLDHIFTSRGQRWTLKSLTIPKGKEMGIDWASVSDHLPVIAVMTLYER